MTLVAGATETGAARWEKLTGEMEMLPVILHRRCNWRVEDAWRVLDAASELLLGEHSYMRAERSPGG